ncbi:ABC transporter permease [bacterium]|nr:ABC transporter permease [bacterium]
MTKYLLRRLLHGLFSIIVVVSIVMILIYSLMDRTLIFAQDTNYTKYANNDKQVYRYERWEDYGYLDYVTYTDYINELAKNGEFADDAARQKVLNFAKKAENDSEEVAVYVKKFTDYYKEKGYEVIRLDAKMLTEAKYATGGKQRLFVVRDIPLTTRLWKFFTGLFWVDNIHNAEGIADEDRGLKFTFNDPIREGKFSPTIMGNGTTYKYLLYTDDRFPYIHQNLFTIKLGLSYTVNQNVDVWKTMTQTQGALVKSEVIYPTGYVVSESAEDLHTARYSYGSRDLLPLYQLKFDDDYTVLDFHLSGMSRMGYSFVIGILSTILAYLLGLPLGIIMARNKDGITDKIGTVYVIFIIAVPSLAYIFMFKAIGDKLFHLPTTFDTEKTNLAMYILPIVSLALPSVAGLMKWLRRYMIDQMNSDYVKFARSGGLSEGEIFTKHIFKNAAIPIVHGIPGSILFSLVGALVTERVYVVPGVGNTLTKAINYYDNGVIVGITLFYSVLSVISIILGDVLMSMVDPRISFSSKGRA